MMTDDECDWRDRVIFAVEQALVTEGLIPVKTLILGEVIDDKGARWIFSSTSSDMRIWDTFGFLQWAIARESAGVATDYQQETP